MKNRGLASAWLAISCIAVLVSLAALPDAQATPVRTLPGLVSITFFERSGGAVPTPFTFGVASTELTTRLGDPLSDSNSDFNGVQTEFYDVFYSNGNGTLNLDGEFVTIEGAFGFALPAGGGLNIAEMALNFSSSPAVTGNFVSSFVALGDNAFPGTVGNAIDGDLQTHTTLGNTIGQSERLRLTLGFLPSSGPPPSNIPEPSTWLLFASGLIALAWKREVSKR
jgi:hypothetical protein